MRISYSFFNKGIFNRSFIALSVSQGLANFGDTLRFIAVTVLLVKISGTGLSAGIGLIFSVLPSIVLSLFAGSLGDILPGKYTLIAVELARAGISMLLIDADDTMTIYVILIAISSMEIIANPSIKKIMLAILGDKHIFTGNSLTSGVLGFTNILGAALSGIIIALWGIEAAFLLNCYSHALAAVFLLLVKVKRKTAYSIRERRSNYKIGKAINYIKSGFAYLKTAKSVRELLSLNVILCFLTISTNMAFYPFAFDELNMTSQSWGVLISIFYGSNLIGSAITLWLVIKLKNPGMCTVYAAIACTALIWFLYRFVSSMYMVFFLQMVEGSALSVCNILLVSRQQLITKENFLARIVGIGDYLGSLGKIAGLGYAFVIITCLSVRWVFIINSIAVFTYMLFKLSFPDRVNNLIAGRIR